MTTRNVPFYIYISYLFIGLLLVFSVVYGWYQYQVRSDELLQGLHRQYRSLSRNVVDEIERTYYSGSMTVELLAQQRSISAKNLTERLDSLRFYVTALKNNPLLVSAYMAYSNGDFFLVRPYPADGSLASFFLSAAEYSLDCAECQSRAGWHDARRIYFL